MKLTPSQQFWKRHINEQQSSGLTQAEYCRAHGLKKSTFSAQKSILSKSDLLENPPSVESSFLALSDINENSISIKLSSGAIVQFDSLPAPSWVARLIGELHAAQPQ